MKITLIISSLEVGGVERAMSIIANYWAARYWQITLLSFDDGSAPPFYDLDKRIEYRSLGIKNRGGFSLATLSYNLCQIRVLKKAIKASRPDLIVSFVNTTNIKTLLACWRLRVPTIVCEHVYPAFGGLSKFGQFLQQRLYRRAALITVQTHSGLSFFPPECGYSTMVMPNPIAVPAADQMESFSKDRHLLAVGKLIPQKGFDLAIKAFAQVCDDRPEWMLTIVGEGEMRGELEDLCAQLGLEDRVDLPGVVKNIDAYLRNADVFVLSSRFEGFPVTLCEAMACGVPVIATDCLSGPREIVHNGTDGLLVVSENVDALAVGIDISMSDPVKRQYFSHHAPKVLDRFGVELVMAMWDAAIRQVLEGRGRL
jgi:GalNAc-alpha-(1->4)-GalNAc-alpha-(1->3)-diNAcBac-PP-undecaprenol alpha-1,4-N-acetyl-D-galactosaminyltransferase